jgi:hypothetical protein
MTRLRLVVEADHAPITDDAEASEELNQHWRTARRAYGDIVRLMGTERMRWLITGPSGPLSRRRFEQFEHDARALAQAATALADVTHRSVLVFQRREEAQKLQSTEEDSKPDA